MGSHRRRGAIDLIGFSVKILVEHIQFVINEKISLVELTKRGDYDEGYLDALDFILNLIEEEEEELVW